MGVLIPRYNEEASIAKVVADFRACLPAATIRVYDSHFRDGTMAAAREAAAVRREHRQGKGRVMWRNAVAPAPGPSSSGQGGR